MLAGVLLQYFTAAYNSSLYRIECFSIFLFLVSHSCVLELKDQCLCNDGMCLDTQLYSTIQIILNLESQHLLSLSFQIVKNEI